MNLIPRSILSVSPGRGRLGVAVFRRGRLIYYRVKSLRQYRSDIDLRNALENILDRLFTRFGIDELRLPELNKQQRHSAGLLSIDKVLVLTARQQKIATRRYDPLNVREMICKGTKPTKANAEQKLAEIYPELAQYRRGDLEWERRYYGFLFSAIAGGCECEIGKQNSDKNGSTSNPSGRQPERVTWI